MMEFLKKLRSYVTNWLSQLGMKSSRQLKQEEDDFIKAIEKGIGLFSSDKWWYHFPGEEFTILSKTQPTEARQKHKIVGIDNKTYHLSAHCPWWATKE